jgi:hypothetical protein
MVDSLELAFKTEVVFSLLDTTSFKIFDKVSDFKLPISMK